MTDRLEIGEIVFERCGKGWTMCRADGQLKLPVVDDSYTVALIDALLAARERVAELDAMMADALVALTASNLTETYMDLSDRYNALWNKEAP